MFAMDHAATALVIARRYPKVPMAAVLVSVQVMELVWVVLNFVGIERITTDPSVHTVAGVHLSHVPYSHSVATMLAAALLAAGALWAATRRRDLAAAVGLGIVSHLVLDLLTHAPDLAIHADVRQALAQRGLEIGVLRLVACAVPDLQDLEALDTWLAGELHPRGWPLRAARRQIEEAEPGRTQSLRDLGDRPVGSFGAEAQLLEVARG